jgi:hypothetical protein
LRVIPRIFISIFMLPSSRSMNFQCFVSRFDFQWVDGMLLFVDVL